MGPFFKNEAEAIAAEIEAIGFEAKAICIVPGEWAVKYFGFNHAWRYIHTRHDLELFRKEYA